MFSYIICKNDYYYDIDNNQWIHKHNMDFYNSKLYSKGPKFSNVQEAIAACPIGYKVHEIKINFDRMIKTDTWVRNDDSWKQIKN